MRPFLSFCFIAAIILTGSSCQSSQEKISQVYGEPADLVNVFVDTHNSRWFYFNSASRPFGMVNLSPDNQTRGSWKSGYLYDSTHIRCFSHVHGWQIAGVAVLPATGKVKGHLGMDEYQSSFSHKGEIAKPGYHKVYLDDYKIWAELTSTNRVGFHRYRFTEPDNPHVLIDLGAWLAHGPTTDTYLRRVSDDLVEGYTVLAGTVRRIKPLTVYFAVKFNKPIKYLGGWRNKALLDKEIKEIKGAETGVFATFPADTKDLMMKVAISYTSMENARLNMDTELSHWDFDRVVKESYNEWNDLLGRIKVEGGTRQQQVKFYTDLWHSLLGRRTMNDVNGNYIDNTGEKPVVRTVRMKDGKPLYPHYNFDALWGCQWSLNILWSFAYPELMDGFANTMIDMYNNGGLIPRGPSGGNYTNVMIGDPASSFFANAYNHGIRDYDIEKMYEGLRKNAFPGGIRDRAGYEHSPDARAGGIAYYVKQGWVPQGIEVSHTAFHSHGTASMTLEYAYQDWCIAQLAKSLGKESDYKLFMKRALNYRNMWNPDTKLMHTREMDGSWIADFKPVDNAGHTRGFVEANAAIYTHYVPHDIAGLTELFGSRQAYTDTLNIYFERSKEHNFAGGKTGALWINYTNQPATGMAHLFNHAGTPWLSQKWVREVKMAFNDTTPYGGYNGDEDQGQMGALGVLMAMGLFSVDGSASVKPFYEITSPVFDRIEISLNEAYCPGGQFVIETRNNSQENTYIRSAKLNGRKWNKCWFYHEDLANGGKLELILGNKPNKSWGVKDLPPSMSR